MNYDDTYMSKLDRRYMEGGAGYRLGRVRLRQLRVNNGEMTDIYLKKILDCLFLSVSFIQLCPECLTGEIIPN